MAGNELNITGRSRAKDELLATADVVKLVATFSDTLTSLARSLEEVRPDIAASCELSQKRLQETQRQLGFRLLHEAERKEIEGQVGLLKLQVQKERENLNLFDVRMNGVALAAEHLQENLPKVIKQVGQETIRKGDAERLALSLTGHKLDDLSLRSKSMQSEILTHEHLKNARKQSLEVDMDLLASAIPVERAISGGLSLLRKVSLPLTERLSPVFARSMTAFAEGEVAAVGRDKVGALLAKFERVSSALANHTIKELPEGVSATALRETPRLPELSRSWSSLTTEQFTQWRELGERVVTRLELSLKPSSTEPLARIYQKQGIIPNGIEISGKSFELTSEAVRKIQGNLRDPYSPALRHAEFPKLLEFCEQHGIKVDLDTSVGALGHGGTYSAGKPPRIRMIPTANFNTMKHEIEHALVDRSISRRFEGSGKAAGFEGISDGFGKVFHLAERNTPEHMALLLKHEPRLAKAIEYRRLGLDKKGIDETLAVDKELDELAKFGYEQWSLGWVHQAKYKFEHQFESLRRVMKSGGLKTEAQAEFAGQVVENLQRCNKILAEKQNIIFGQRPTFWAPLHEHQAYSAMMQRRVPGTEKY